MRMADAISKKANMLIRKYHTRVPFELAKSLGIHVLWTDEFVKLKGMYTVQKRERYIILNRKMDERTAAIVCAHEIGHDMLHREMARATGIQEFALYDISTRPEYEANIFAATILLDEEQMLEYIFHYQYDAEQIAKAMNSDINLVALKTSELVTKGYKLRTLESKSDFLK